MDFGSTLSKKAIVLAMRSWRSGKVFSSSAMARGSTLPTRTAHPLAVSLMRWICLDISPDLLINFNLAIAGYLVGKWLHVFYETGSEEGRLIAFDMIEALCEELGEYPEFGDERDDADFVECESRHIGMRWGGEWKCLLERMEVTG